MAVKSIAPITDHVQQARARKPFAFQSLPALYPDPVGLGTVSGWDALLGALIKPAQEFEDTCHALLAAMDLDSATGQALDNLGSKLGVLREGRDDSRYRNAIYIQIAANTSLGQYNDISNILALVGVENFNYIEPAPATFLINLGAGEELDLLDYIEVIGVTKAAGIATDITGTPNNPDSPLPEDYKIFGFQGTPNAGTFGGSYTETIYPSELLEPTPIGAMNLVVYETSYPDLGIPVEYQWKWNDSSKFLEIVSCDNSTNLAAYANYKPNQLYGGFLGQLTDADGNVWEYSYPFRFGYSSVRIYPSNDRVGLKFNGEPYDRNTSYPEVLTTVPASGEGNPYLSNTTQFSTYWPGAPSGTDPNSYLSLENFLYVWSDVPDTVINRWEGLADLPANTELRISEFALIKAYRLYFADELVNLQLNVPFTSTITDRGQLSEGGYYPEVGVEYIFQDFIFLLYVPPGESINQGSYEYNSTITFSQMDVDGDDITFTISDVRIYTDNYNPVTGEAEGFTYQYSLGPDDFFSWRDGFIKGTEFDSAISDVKPTVGDLILTTTGIEADEGKVFISYADPYTFAGTVYTGVNLSRFFRTSTQITGDVSIPLEEQIVETTFAGGHYTLDIGDYNGN